MSKAVENLLVHLKKKGFQLLGENKQYFPQKNIVTNFHQNSGRVLVAVNHTTEDVSIFMDQNPMIFKNKALMHTITFDKVYAGLPPLQQQGNQRPPGMHVRN